MKANRIIFSTLDYGTTIISNVRMKTLLFYVLLFRLFVVVLACIILYIYIYITAGQMGRTKTHLIEQKYKHFPNFDFDVCMGPGN